MVDSKYLKRKRKVHYRKLGSTNITVSEIGFGAWQLANKGWNGSQDKEAKELV